MSYQASIAAKIVQFGSTIMDINLVDDEGIMPDVRTVYRWKKTTQITNPELIAARNILIARYTALWQEQQEAKANRAAFLEKLGDFMDRRIEILQGSLTDYIEASSLTPAQKALASKIRITWTMED